MTDPNQQVLAELGTMAADGNWPRTAAFLQALPRGTTSVVLFAADQSEVEPIVGWLAEHVAEPADRRPLTASAVSPDRLLAADRTVVTLRAGRLLELEEVQAIATILDRPDATRRIVLIGSATDDNAAWTAAERMIWRALLGVNEDWREQDLGGSGCLRWAPPGGAEDPRVVRDRTNLRVWLTAHGDHPDLARMRAAYALDLAESEQSAARAGRDGTEDRAHLLPRVRRTRRRAATQLDALAGSSCREVNATLDMLRADLLTSTAREMRPSTRGRFDHRIAAAVAETHLDQRIREWLAGTYGDIGGRVHEAFQVVADDLEDLDWDSQTADGARLRSRRDAVTAALRRPPRLRIPSARTSELVTMPAAGDPSVTVFMALGALAGAAVGFVLPVPAGTVAGAALGAVGGRLVQHQRSAAAVDAWIGRHVEDTVTSAVNTLRGAARERLTAVIVEQRGRADALLDELERDLAAGDRTPSPAPDGRPALAALRRSLT